VSQENPTNVSASVRQKLLNKARSEKRPFGELLQYYAMERFLYRLSQSVHSDRYILKGALMLRVWQAPEIRPTMDIDMLGKTSNDELSIVSQMKDVLSVDIKSDGLLFDLASIQYENITEDADYHGARIKFKCLLDTAKINMQIDIGFGDIVYPEPTRESFPTILNDPSALLYCYSKESTIAEKFEAMIKLGELNSRMKDFYDIWLLSRKFIFKGEALSKAIELTFEKRQTALPNKIELFTQAFVDDKQIQWQAFIKKLNLKQTPDVFAEIVEGICIFLDPVVLAVTNNVTLSKTWSVSGRWK